MRGMCLYLYIYNLFVRARKWIDGQKCARMCVFDIPVVNRTKNAQKKNVKGIIVTVRSSFIL